VFEMYEWILLGSFLGLLIGLLPGMHTNTVIAVLISLGLVNSNFGVLALSMLSGHILSSFFLSMFANIADSDNVVSLLPTQRLIKAGKGDYALFVLLFSFGLSVLISYLLLPFANTIYGVIRPVFHLIRWLVPIISTLIIFRTKSIKNSLVFFLLSGIFGILVFNLNLTDPFLPMFSGMFALPWILSKERDIEGNTHPKVTTSSELRLGIYIIVGVLLGMIADVIPGVSSPSQMAMLASYALFISTDGFLALVVSTTVSEYIFSMLTLGVFNKARIGGVLLLFNSFKLDWKLMIFVFSISALISIVVFYFFRKQFFTYIKYLWKFRYVTVFVIILGTLFLDGLVGVVVLVVGYFVGLLTQKTRTERINLMGSIIIPMFF